MDDANLSKLLVNRPGLVPIFNKDIIDYYITVPHNVEELNVKVTTSDTGASYSIKGNTGFGEDVKLMIGENKITIEVTSEDGTVKKYFINSTRLSASDAILKSIEFTSKNVEFKPKFNHKILEYISLVEYKTVDVKFKLELFDSNCSLDVLVNKIKLDKTNDEYQLNLYYGYTELTINVTSPNKSNSQNYVIKLTRSVIPRIASFLNIKDKIEFEDGFSLAPFYCPVKLSRTITNSPIYSKQFLQTFQKMLQSNDSLNVISLISNQNDEKVPCFKTENEISNIIVKVPYLNGGNSSDIKLCNMSNHIDEINNNDEIKLNEDEIKNHNNPLINKIPDDLPSYQTKPWEKHYMIIYDETDALKLNKMSESHCQKYLDLLLTSENSIKSFSRDTNDSPLYYLNMAIYNMASSIKYKSKDYEVHFKLAALLEEKNFFENIYGKEKKDEKDDSIPLTLSLQNKLISDGSKEEEINAICKARNFGDKPSDTDKLKALDQEYHYLIENNQNHKAEQVQLLYQFKSKKINEASKSNALRMSHASDYLIQSNLKYVDGLSVFLESKITNFQVYFTVGRSYCLIRDYKNALIYLKPCINWSDLQFQTLSRFYYGFALSKQQDFLGSNTKLVADFIIGGLQAFLRNLSISLSYRKKLISHDNYSIFNTIFLESFLTLAKIKCDYKNIDLISAEDCLKYCAWICCIALNEINSRTILNTGLITTSNLIKDIVRILIESHSNLINLNFRVEPSSVSDYRSLQSKRCLNLINIIRSVSEKDDKYILKLQENAAERLVFADPFDSYYLLLLGCSKFEFYEYLSDNVKNVEEDYLNELLNESKNSLMAIIEYDSEKNKDEISTLITEQKWWNNLVAQEQMSLASIQSITTTTTERPPSKTKNSTLPTTSKTSVKGSNSTPVKSQNAKKTAVQPTKTPTKNLPVSNKSDCKPNQVRPSSKPSSAEAKEPAKKSTVPIDKPEILKYIRTNKQTFDKDILNIQVNLYLGRVYSKIKQIDKAKNFYFTVIKKEPNNRDSYIELAKILRENGDVAGAVDALSSYPILEQKNENQLFEDAFIYGEIVTLLINTQKFDDPRLSNYCILWARIMGVAIIEKYINILDKANKTKVCKEIYAGVNKKSVDDPDLVQFFKFKGWI